MRLAIDNVPRALHLKFKSYVVGIDMTLAEAIMALMETEVVERKLETRKRLAGDLPPIDPSA